MPFHHVLVPSFSAVSQKGLLNPSSVNLNLTGKFRTSFDVKRTLLWIVSQEGSAGEFCENDNSREEMREVRQPALPWSQMTHVKEDTGKLVLWSKNTSGSQGRIGKWIRSIKGRVLSRDFFFRSKICGERASMGFSTRKRDRKKYIYFGKSSDQLHARAPEGF